MCCSVLVFASCFQFHKQPGKWIQIVAIKDAPEAAKVTAEDLECGEMERTVSLSQIGFLIRSHVSSNDHSLSLQIKTTPRRTKIPKYKTTPKPNLFQRSFHWCVERCKIHPKDKHASTQKSTKSDAFVLHSGCQTQFRAHTAQECRTSKPP